MSILDKTMKYITTIFFHGISKIIIECYFLYTFKFKYSNKLFIEQLIANSNWPIIYRLYHAFNNAWTANNDFTIFWTDQFRKQVTDNQMNKYWK